MYYGTLIFMSQQSNEVLLQVEPTNVLHNYPLIQILDNITFYKNQAGSNSFRVGNGNNCCILTDDGTGSFASIISNGDIYSFGYLTGVKGIDCPEGYVSGIAFVNNSKKETKKNIKKFDKSALDIIRQTDIYEFNYNAEKDETKKHLGFVIGEGYKYAKEITAENKGKEIGADIYSMVSVAYKAIQEQQDEIEQLKDIINKQQEQINKLLQGGEK